MPRPIFPAIAPKSPPLIELDLEKKKKSTALLKLEGSVSRTHRIVLIGANKSKQHLPLSWSQEKKHVETAVII